MSPFRISLIQPFLSDLLQAILLISQSPKWGFPKVSVTVHMIMNSGAQREQALNINDSVSVKGFYLSMPPSLSMSKKKFINLL